MTKYEERFSRWFATFAAQLESRSASKTNNRLAELHRALVRLLRQLDVEQLLLQFDENKRLLKPQWAQPSKLAEPTKHTGAHPAGH